MSPATPLDATAAVSTGAGALLTLRLPLRARQGLHILAVIAWPTSVEPDLDELGWDELGRVTDDTGSIAVLRRAATPDEPAAYVFEFAGELEVGDPAPSGVMIVATGIGGGLASDAASTEFSAATSFVAPSANAGGYSDVALRVFYAASDGEFFFADPSLLIALAGADGANDASLAVTWSMPEQGGPTGTLEAEILAANGIAATFTLPAALAAQAPRWDEPIAIGLPTVGV